MDTAVTIASLAASVASLALAVIAIWIALYGKSETDRTNQKTQDLLTEIRGDARSIAQYAIPELRAYGDSVRRFVFEKGEPSSEPAVTKLEKLLAANMAHMDKQLSSIREETDLSVVRNFQKNLLENLKIE